jgi:hypothetical protein
MRHYAIAICCVQAQRDLGRSAGVVAIFKESIGFTHTHTHKQGAVFLASFKSVKTYKFLYCLEREKSLLWFSLVLLCIFNFVCCCNNPTRAQLHSSAQLVASAQLVEIRNFKAATKIEKLSFLFSFFLSLY